MSQKILTSSEIITQLKQILAISQDTELAEFLGIEKQSIYQYKQKSNVDIQQRIICCLLNKWNETDNK